MNNYFRAQRSLIHLLCSCLLIAAFTLSSMDGLSQSSGTYQLWEPLADSLSKIGGRLPEARSRHDYGRLPERAATLVRKGLWNLSLNSAGTYVEFQTDAAEIMVRYNLAGSNLFERKTFPGNAGIDLYAKDRSGKWHWATGTCRFGDTVEYWFRNIDKRIDLTHFRLYFPLHNAPKWLQIGVKAGNTLTPVQPSIDKPIVCYGTSILQGGSATRAGLAWGNILGRMLDRHIINLGFSGNGMLETPLIDLVNMVDASAYVLDCLPNLTDSGRVPDTALRRLIVNAVKTLRATHHHTPIVLVEHASGYPGFCLDDRQNIRYTRVNKIMHATYREMVKEMRIKGLYLLSAAQIGLTAEGSLDGTHPNDLGMYKYATAYSKLLSSILQ
ncbi:SGNH/GDSL hydrolase family protein [Paraflavitalea sp. CAU 1676]|uniref:SGNH/GDSL hydrolase family protein n=1 Tax=Paraflavitalea sp. CAU 1676 TaxID=3032598 RepID=UPI0023DC9F06|nr:SGNH/GDSL hydrolase family protein [Paraflavitalea sp. CAU 1676]MDF2193495.1 SGNH/GDSL hydrolase family protein [Paraflavitalea sp. CAU 1676]